MMILDLVVILTATGLEVVMALLILEATTIGGIMVTTMEMGMGLAMETATMVVAQVVVVVIIIITTKIPMDMGAMGTAASEALEITMAAMVGAVEAISVTETPEGTAMKVVVAVIIKTATQIIIIMAHPQMIMAMTITRALA